MSRLHHTGAAATAAAFAAAVAVTVTFASTTRAAVPPPPASGHAEVIAQAAIAFGPGPAHWTVTAESLRPNSAAPAGSGAPAFIVVTDGAAIPTGPDDRSVARIGAGEGAYLPPEAGLTLLAADGAPVRLHRIELADGGAATPESTLSPGEGVRDVDVLRDVLQPGETLAIADSPAAPTLVLAIAGDLEVVGAPDGSASLTAGASNSFDGAVTLVNGGSEAASVVAIVIGPPVQTTPQAPVATTASTSAAAPTTPPPGPTQPDRDSDGLSDDDEARLGTMPDDPDSDGDGLSDGDEVHRYGTDPLSSRTDFDHLDDGEEIERGTDPLDEDTDDDGCYDSSDDNPLVGDGDCDGDTLSFQQEQQLGTDPANPDTDEDGMDDDSDPQPLTPGDGSPTPVPTTVAPAPPPPPASAAPSGSTA